MMKKLFTLCIFVFALLLGTETVSAQDATKMPEVIAKEKTYKLSQEFGLSGEQQRLVWRAFLAREQAKLEVAEGSYSEAEIKNIYKKVDDSFHTSMQKYLGDEQYEKFKLIMKDYL